MIRGLMHHLIGTISVIFYFLNTVLWATPIIILSFFQTYTACALETIYIVYLGRVRNRMDYD